MDVDVFKKQIAVLVKKAGREPVQAALRAQGLGLSTAQKIVKGDYQPGLKALRAMAQVIELAKSA